VRDNSRLFYAECTAFPSPLAVKLCLRPRTVQPDSDSAQRQHDALLRVFRALGNAGQFTVPRPYLVRADAGLLATEWIAGDSMNALLLSWRCSRAVAQRLLARAGRWLRCFHDAHALVPARVDLEDKLTFVAEMRDAHAVHDPVFFAALRRLCESAEAAAEVSVARSWIHGDFKADNLLVSGPRTVGMDIHLRHESPVIYDLAPFLNHLELGLCHPRGWRFAGCRALLREAFLTSYFGARSEALDVALSWVQLYLLLQGWHTAREHARSWLRCRLIDHSYRLVASRLAARLTAGGAAMAQTEPA
jgi:hypothetical protein